MTSFSRPRLRIATRASQLALWQSNYIADLIRKVAPQVEVELIHVSTTGDRDQTEALKTLGSFGVFTREVQLAILDHRADIAVHSLKDLPTEASPSLTLAATPTRGPTHDALVLPGDQKQKITIKDLPADSRIGTGSPRRQAQLRHLRPDLRISEVRGNVDTRLRKLDAGDYDALVLAVAGLSRLNLANRITADIGPPEMYPAVGQGAVGVECRADDHDLRSLLQQINDSATMSAITAERSLLATLRAGCHAPVGVDTRIQNDTLQLEAVVLSQDGQRYWTATASAPIVEAETIGKQVAEMLIAQGASQVLNIT